MVSKVALQFVVASEAFPKTVEMPSTCAPRDFLTIEFQYLRDFVQATLSPGLAHVDDGQEIQSHEGKYGTGIGPPDTFKRSSWSSRGHLKKLFRLAPEPHGALPDSRCVQR